MLVGEPTSRWFATQSTSSHRTARVEGQVDAVPAYRLLSLRDVPERRHGELFVGREHELAILKEAWERVQSEQRCELVTVAGDAGIGESRLAAEVWL